MLNLKIITNMKNRIQLFIKYMLFGFVLLIYSCNNDSIKQIFIQQPNSSHLTIDGDAPFLLNFKTGDTIGINGDKVVILNNGLVGLHDVPAVKEYFIYYPNSIEKNDSEFQFIMPQMQSYNDKYIDASSCPFLANIDNLGLENVKLKPVLGALKMTIPANSDFGSVSSVIIESKTNNLRGILYIDPLTGIIKKVEEGSHKIVLNGPIDVSKDFSLVVDLIPQRFIGKLSVKLVSSKGYGQYDLDLSGKSIRPGKMLAVKLTNIKWQRVTYYYGKANSVIVKPDQTSVKVDCGAYYTTNKNYAYEDSIADDSRLPLSAHQLWNDVSVDFVKSVTLSPDRKSFTVNLDGKKGNALIAIYDKKNPKDRDAKILWSFHIWVTDVKEQLLGTNINGNTYIVLDRNLGATSALPKDAHTVGLLYQWGRKDPFVGTNKYGNNSNCKMYNEKGEVAFSVLKGGRTSGTVQYSIEHPTAFIMYSHNKSNKSIYPYYAAYDWLYYENLALWGNPEGYDFPKASFLSKSIYDPSPAGYMVAPNDTWFESENEKGKHSNIFINATWDNGYTNIGIDGSKWWYPIGGWRGRKDGNLTSANTNGYYWYSSVDGEKSINSGLLILGENVIKLNAANSRANACSIRCVKIVNK